MDPVEDILKTALRDKPPASSRETAVEPSWAEWTAFLEGTLGEEAQEKVLLYIRKNPQAQKWLGQVRELLKEKDSARPSNVSGALKNKAKRLFSSGGALACPHCGKAVASSPKPISRQRFENALWLSAGAVFFAVSFVERKFFLQFLVLGALCGFRWIFAERATRTQILIYKALRENEKMPHKDGDLHRLSRHL